MSRHIASFISVLFNPLLMPSAVFLILFYFAPIAIPLPNPGIKTTILFSIFITTFVLPLASLLAFRLTTVAKLNMPERKDRALPYIFVAILYSVVAYFFAVKLNLNAAMNVVFVAIALSVLLGALITLFWQISMHCVGMGGALGFIMAFSMELPDSGLLLPLTVLIICSGLVASSRLYLNSHDPMEIYAGCALGFAVCFGSIVLFL